MSARDPIGDWPRCRRALRVHAELRGRTFLVRKITQRPLWWQWTEAINIALVAELMADLVIKRGGLLREWP